MRKIFDELAVNLSKPINTSAISIMALYTFAWGVWLMMPWKALSISPASNLLRTLAPEPALGIAAILIGSIMFYGVIKNNYRSLRRGATAGFYFWFTIALLNFFSFWRSTGWITAGMVSFYCFFVAVNLRVNRKKSFDLHDNKNTNNMKP
ncbi:membrane protein [Streptomyces phage Coruscant]|uniref:Membrane protein n=1 Tax=Streptomyces phage Coruscant TaxID=2739834 RepID=A0A7G4AVZ0_9CAUD|nr:membrane protein [Streptomyces phage Coruscant]QMP84180.1 membrane protein [Streptomyces phage Coruscant]